MDKYVKRIQSRLTALKATLEGRTVPMWMVRQYYEVLVADRYNPTEAELAHVVESIKAKLQEPTEPTEPEVTELATVEPEVTMPQPEIIEITPEENPDLWEILQPPGAIASADDDFEIIALNGLTDECLTTADEWEDSAPLPDDQEDGWPESALTNRPPREQNSLAKPNTPGSALNFPTDTDGQLTKTEVTQAIAQAIAQVGEQGNAQAVEILTSLANELSSDISDTQQMVSALVRAYLVKRQNVLSSAIGTLRTLQTAQTDEFQSGLNKDFFAHKDRKKRQFLEQVEAMFN